MRSRAPDARATIALFTPRPRSSADVPSARADAARETAGTPHAARAVEDEHLVEPRVAREDGRGRRLDRPADPRIGHAAEAAEQWQRADDVAERAREARSGRAWHARFLP
jgi:hypothetical protein